MIRLTLKAFSFGKFPIKNDIDSVASMSPEVSPDSIPPKLRSASAELIFLAEDREKGRFDIL
jgi:hypothetical protein